MESLNQQQRRAVAITTGPALVVAGAGTGKTRVITERIRRLIDDGIATESILALTFTEKAAAEMRDRIAESSLSDALAVTASTFNGFGNELLRQYGIEYGLGNLRLLGETGQLVFMTEHFDELELEYFAPVSNPDGQLSSLREYISALKQQLVSVADYQQYCTGLPTADEADRLEKTRQLELARLYQNYQQLCRREQVIDYDDQIYLTVQLLQDRPNVLRRLHDRYHYILVDEFQDTNPMQSRLVDVLAGDRQNLMVVGDDDQSIYGWRGATLANILDFSKRYPNAQNITLLENYRSTQPILDASYRLIQNNDPQRLEVITGLNKRLHAQSAGEQPRVQHFTSFEAELSWLAATIAEQIAGGQDPAQIAVLARGRQTAQRVHEALESQDIEHVVSGQKGDLYRQPAVRQLIEVLQAINDPRDDTALFHAMAGPVCNLPAESLASFASQARAHHDSLQTVITGSDDEAANQQMTQLQTWLQQGQNLSVGELAYKVLTDSGWKQRLYNQARQDTDAVRQVQALSEYFTTLKEFGRATSLPSLQSYLRNLPALQAGGSDFEDSSLQISNTAVNIMTIHASKGLEWDSVFIVDCLEQSFPLTSGSRSSLVVPEALLAVHSAADTALAEERRLMYVAATRSRRQLTLTYSDRHGNGAPRKPSRFIAEMFAEPAETIVATNEQLDLERFAPTVTDAVVGLPASMLQDDQMVITASQIETWLQCPQDFYYKYVLHMPEPESPAAAFGTAVHQAIQSIFDGRRTNVIPEKQAILDHLSTELPKTGYATAGVRERAHTLALASMATIYDRFVDEELPTRDELPFTVAVPDVPVKIVGRIDAIYERPDGVEIRDFKTSSSVTTPEKAKSRASNSQQLTVYALAWQLLHGELPRILTLDFVVTNQLSGIRKTARGVNTLLDKLALMNEQLRAGHYPPGKKHDYCRHPH